MEKSTKYESAVKDAKSLGTVVPKQLAEYTARALAKLSEALDGEVSGYVANRLHMSHDELQEALAAEQIDSVALAMYNIEKRGQAVVIGDQTGIGKGRQAAAMIRYGLLSGYLPVFFTDRYTLFSDMYRDCKALGIKDARPLVVNAGASVVDFDHVVEQNDKDGKPDDIWVPYDEEDSEKHEAERMALYQKQYEVVYKAPKKPILQEIFRKGDVPTDAFDYLMITYSQLKDARRDMTRLNFLRLLCEGHRVLFVFDEAHKSSGVNAGTASIITQGINMILEETPQSQCVFLSATFAKRPECLLTFMRRTALSALATENTLKNALHYGGVPMQEYVSSCLAAEGQMIRREHSGEGLPTPVYTYLDEDLEVHGEQFDKVMYFFREIVKLSAMVGKLVNHALMQQLLLPFKCYPTRAQLFYINKVLLLSLKAKKVAQAAIDNVKEGRSVVIGMSDTLECIVQDVTANEDGSVRGDISTLLLRLLEKTVCGSGFADIAANRPIWEIIEETDDVFLKADAKEINDYYTSIRHDVEEEVFHLPVSPIDVMRQLITAEKFVAPNGEYINIRFEECTGRARQLEYLSPEGDDDFINAVIKPRKKRHSNLIFNDFQNNKLDVILINACGAIGASAHAISTTEVPEDQVRQRKMLIVQNDLDVNIDLQKRGRINRTGQRMDLPPLYEYIITAIPSEKRLNMMLRAKLRSLSANTAAWQDQDREQADFVDIDNKYGNEVAKEYMKSHPELAMVLDLTRNVTASRLLARSAMLSVAAQQDIVDDLIAGYTTLEDELRRINQWDLEREFRDFEADFVRDELFTTAKAKNRLGGCSYLSTYKCKQKTFPYSYDTLTGLCKEAKAAYGNAYKENPALQKQVKDYYARRDKEAHRRFKARCQMLLDGAKRILAAYCGNEEMADAWLQKACTPSSKWDATYFNDVKEQERAKQIMRKLVSFSNEYNHLLDAKKQEMKKYAEERKRLIKVLSKAEIGSGYDNIREQLDGEVMPQKVKAVLRDIRFGKDDRTRFLPSRVELVFALTAVYTEIRINLVHNSKWSNYKRLLEILESHAWQPNASVWDKEIALYNNKIVERKIITGNILGAYVHPAIAELKPRFISFSLKEKDVDKPHTQIGLLLPMDESKIRKTLNTVSIPLHEGFKYATNTNTCYTIAGLGVNFSLMPYAGLKYVVSVNDNHSKDFEKDKRFDGIRSMFLGTPISSIYDKAKEDKEQPNKKKRKTLMHYQTEELSFESEQLQSIIQTLAQMDAVIVVPRDQITYGDVKEYVSRSERDDNEPWDVLDWKNVDEVPMPPIRESLMLRISSPVAIEEQKGKPVFRHSERYILAQETMELEGLSLNQRSTIDALRRCYMKWKDYYRVSATRVNQQQELQPSLVEQREVCRDLQRVTRNDASSFIGLSTNVKALLQDILDSEYLDPAGLYYAKFEDEMLFMSPDKSVAQAFLDAMPCSTALDGIKNCIEDYLNDKTDIINSPDTW